MLHNTVCGVKSWNQTYHKPLSTAQGATFAFHTLLSAITTKLSSFIFSSVKLITLRYIKRDKQNPSIRASQMFLPVEAIAVGRQIR